MFCNKTKQVTTWTDSSILSQNQLHCKMYEFHQKCYKSWISWPWSVINFSYAQSERGCLRACCPCPPVHPSAILISSLCIIQQYAPFPTPGQSLWSLASLIPQVAFLLFPDYCISDHLSTLPTSVQTLASVSLVLVLLPVLKHECFKDTHMNVFSVQPDANNI